MKKVMFAAAVAASLGLFADGIESANTVGYMTYQSGLGIENIGAAVAPINASGEWTCSSNVYDSAANDGDVVMFLNPDLFDLDAYQYDGSTHKWTYNTTDLITGDPIMQEVASFTLGKGTVTYCQPGDGVSGFTTAGEVESGTSATVTFENAGFYEFVNPFPKDTTIADLTFAQDGDVVLVLNFEIFDLDAYQYDGATGKWTYNSTDPISGDPVQEVITDTSTVVLPAGQGGYLQPANGDCTWTVSL